MKSNNIIEINTYRIPILAVLLIICFIFQNEFMKEMKKILFVNQQ